jgi:hypothetical protein
VGPRAGLGGAENIVYNRKMFIKLSVTRSVYFVRPLLNVGRFEGIQTDRQTLLRVDQNSGTSNVALLDGRLNMQKCTSVAVIRKWRVLNYQKLQGVRLDRHSHFRGVRNIA